MSRHIRLYEKGEGRLDNAVGPQKDSENHARNGSLLFTGRGRGRERAAVRGINLRLYSPA